ncbi:MAG: bifunctional adenosylcobinamide kinase/adenosylcobinamide-phosphate guanylyltransferase [Parvibaculaceae bacterium]|nr:bifunctional adenosylcobinamide kinase/adenosylcobinamide-phosphate guanylyltransferase [Parvibaculaceae bacterium]
MTQSTFSLPAHGPFAALVLGGARSGKSRYGEQLVERASGQHVYVATAQAWDGEMEDRIVHHQNRRGDTWVLIEEPLALADLLRTKISENQIVLVDCLTLWLSNLMGAEKNIETSVDDLIEAVRTCKGRAVFISNEVGQGIVPDNAMARLFRDEAGRMHQRLAEVCDAAIMVVAGLPLILKQP